MGNQCCTPTPTLGYEYPEVENAQASQYEACAEPTIMNYLILNRIKSLPPVEQKDVFDIPGKPAMRHKNSGLIYVGQWKNQRPFGKGKLYLTDGQYFEGSFVNGLASCKGRFYFENGDYYEGAVQHCRANGNGTYVSSDFEFTGSWANSEPIEGQYKLLNGTTVTLSKDKSASTITYPDGSIYKGSVNKFRPEGHGTLSMKNGNVYQGDWHEGKMHGKGHYKWRDGSSYQGSYVKGKKEGEGKFHFEDGSVYEGEWANGVPNGVGKKTLKSGEVQNGRWHNGQKV